MTKQQRYRPGSTTSVLDELLGGPQPAINDAEPEPEAGPEALPVPEAPAAAPAAAPPAAPPPAAAPAKPAGGSRVDPAAEPRQTPARPSNRTPVGKTRQTFYVDDEIAVALNDTADAMVEQLRRLVPKHRVLGALITAGLAQAGPVAEQLRAELLADLQP